MNYTYSKTNSQKVNANQIENNNENNNGNSENNIEKYNENNNESNELNNQNIIIDEKSLSHVIMKNLE